MGEALQWDHGTQSPGLSTRKREAGRSEVLDCDADGFEQRDGIVTRASHSLSIQNLAEFRVNVSLCNPPPLKRDHQVTRLGRRRFPMIDDNLCPAHSLRGDFLYIGLAGAYRIDMRSRRNVGIGKDRRR